jgi:hypothetical protein
MPLSIRSPINREVCMQPISCVTLFCLLLLNAPINAAPPCEARNLDFGKEVWAHLPLSKLKRDTVYTKAKEGSRIVLNASAESSASFYAARFKKPVAVPTSVSWSWKTDALVPDADNRDKAREDAPLRVLVAFDGDHATLPEAEKKRFDRARKLSGKEIPYAVLMYIWGDHVPVGTVIPSAHTSQVKMLVVASGTNGLGKWQSVQRKLADDYRRAYAADPGPVIGVAVMTDTDNTGAKAAGQYADIRFECGAR